MDPLGWLYSLEHFGIKFGLENIGLLLDELGRPDRAFASVHIAGTNGKGSVTAMVDAMLLASRHRSARYTSPHLVDICERFVVSGRQVERAALADALATIRTAVERLIGRGVLAAPPTFFEVTTAAAFELFRREKVSIAVCEVGLGGRLDATNVLQPLVTAITTVAFDHEQHLGHTLEAIAREKAGIIKRRVPVIVGRLPPEARRVIGEVAAALDAPVVDACDEQTLSRVNRLTRALAGAHQADNAAVAVRAAEMLAGRGVEVPADAIAAGLAATRWPGRLEWRQFAPGRTALLDAAHNPHGAAALAAFLRATEPPLPLVLAVMGDKDVRGIIRELAPVVNAVACTRASTPRAAAPDALADEVRRLAPALPCRAFESPRDALEYAWQRSPRIVVAGSIFLLGDVVQMANRVIG